MRTGKISAVCIIRKLKQPVIEKTTAMVTPMLSFLRFPRMKM